MVFTNCTCLRTCQDPNNCVPQCYNQSICQCPDDFFMNGSSCVSKEECGCYLDDYVIPVLNGTLHMNHNCTKNCSCIDDQLTCEEFQCSVDANCTTANGTGQCVCKHGFSGDGETCVQISDCYDIFKAGFTEDGVYSIYPTDWPSDLFDVYCEMSEGGWTVFQRNGAGNTSFQRSWSEYKDGFGNIQDIHWLGNEKLYYLTKQKTYKLYVVITTATNSSLYAEYSDFKIDPETGNYRITSVGDYAGNAGSNGLQSSFGYSFSTYDMDNDGLGTEDCAESHRGGWWYGGNFYISSKSLCNAWLGQNNVYYSCGVTNLNGNVMGMNAGAPFWGESHGENCNLYRTEMKLIPSLFKIK
ncbi:Fibrinogen C domain-containing protein 1 [Holothuria leucospilota]|uniref:Fibrinogen C domain-containing protein 1 n=1 Tax=Holothuria leucospilota TaxID=206669 RepID=A0A9Q1BUU4_HOLLE|nr:Fibrinogen C domain-containing protein 1 [Holothuria leucospilota]